VIPPVCSEGCLRVEIAPLAKWLSVQDTSAGSLDMPLADVEISIDESVLPDEIGEFLREADWRIGRYFQNKTAGSCGFVPSDFVTVYHALRAIVEASLASGNSFCEWGSGFGVVASLAAMLEFDACGIEIDGDLVDASRNLAEDFDLPVDFVHGSFIPPGDEALADEACADHHDGLSFLVTDADTAYDELGLNPVDSDVVFAYPWPGEEQAIEILFENNAAVGALLLTYKDHSVRLQRQVSGRSCGL